VDSRHGTSNLSASVGFIALFRVAMLNRVVLPSSIKQVRNDGASIRDAVLSGATRRLRPVMMTARVPVVGSLQWRSTPPPAPRCNDRWRRS
jgi:Cu/Ag efflux pump CusA